MIKFLSGLFIGLLLAQAAADTRASVPIDNEASFRAGWKNSIWQVSCHPSR
jgi:hypothetical protein